MSSTKVKSVEQVTKKPTLRKKSVEKIPTEKKESAIKTKKESAPKTAKPTKVGSTTSKKETNEVKATKEKKTSPKKEVAEKDEEKPEKKPKNININATIADACGLNLSVAKVKNIVSNLCINAEITLALKDMLAAQVPHNCTDSKVDNEKNKEFTFSLDDLAPATNAYLEACQQTIIETNNVAHSRIMLKKLTSAELKEYNELKRVANDKFHQDQKTNNLFGDDKFDLTKFNLEYNPKFYDDMEDLNASWKSLKNEELYKYCVVLVNKSKIRFNSESKIFITAFVEYIFKQLVINGTKNCVEDGKKIIQLEHALDNVKSEFTMFPFISSLTVYKNYLKSNASSDESAAESDEEEEEEDDADSEDGEKPVVVTKERLLQFKYYVGELCRGVRMELSEVDELVTDALASKFNQTSVSKNFKQFCSDGIIEILQTFGKFLKTEVITRNIKTVNYAINEALVYNTHIIHNLDPKDTVAFIQDKYTIYSKFLVDRQAARAITKAEKA